MSAHTPGPWKAVALDTGARIQSDETNFKGRPVAWVGPNDTIQLPGGKVMERMDAEAKANARLIAAAPDLLEALRNILEIGKRDTSNPKYDGYFEAARAVLAKAGAK